MQIVMLNGSHDRESSRAGYDTGPMKASDVVQAIVDALNRRRQDPAGTIVLQNDASDYITHLIVPKGGDIEVDREKLSALGVRDIVEVASSRDEQGRIVYDPDGVVRAIGCLLLGQGLVPCVPSL